jgi:hypothetical protein
MTDPAPTTPRRRGCLFYGCLTGIVCLVAILVAALIGLHMVRKAFLDYTDTAPMVWPAAEMSATQTAETQRRFQSFVDGLRAGQTVAPLALTGPEVNALIASTNSSQKALSDSVRLSIDDNHLKGEVSIPLRGRYLNGSGTFVVSLQNGVLNLNVQSLTVKGKPLPPSIMTGLRAQNFAANAQNDPNIAPVLNHLQDIQLKNGQLLLIPKPAQDSAPAQKGEAEGKTPN